MEFGKLTLVLGAALTMGICGVGAAACSSSSGNGGGSGSSSGASGSSSGGADGSGSSSGGTDGSGSSSGGGDDGGGDGGVDCGSTPSLHQNPTGDVYCGYGADGGKLECLTGNQCCLGGEIGTSGMYNPQVCSAWTADGTGCPNGSDGGGSQAAVGIACNQISDCTTNGNGGNACCLLGASTPAMPAGCSYLKAKGGTAIVCEGSSSSEAGAGEGGAGEGGTSAAGTCGGGEVQICSADVDCPSGQHCVAGKWKIYQIGFCQ